MYDNSFKKRKEKGFRIFGWIGVTLFSATGQVSIYCIFEKKSVFFEKKRSDMT